MSAKAKQVLLEEGLKRGVIALDDKDPKGYRVINPSERCLWASPCDKDTAESAIEFVKLCWTWNEAEQESQPFPDKEYLWAYVREWHDCKKAGRTLMVEKCRRMVISWLDRALMLHQMGLKRTDCVLIGEDYEAAAKHVWRIKFLYDGLRDRNPSWNLPEIKSLRYEGDKALKQVSLANGSVCEYGNGESSQLQGSGVALVSMEELPIYRYPESILAQAKLITQGSANTVGGFIVTIGNASVNKAWQDIKKNSGLAGHPDDDIMVGVSGYNLKSGARGLKIHYNADPEKDSKWLNGVRLDMSDTPFDFEVQILMNDKASPPMALFTQAEIEASRVEAMDFKPLKIIVSVDPAVTSSDKSDDTGIAVLAACEDSNVYYLLDVGGKYHPNQVASVVTTLCKEFGTSTVVYESNQGGDYVKAMILNANPYLEMVPVHAHQGKAVRAETAQMMLKRGRLKFVGFHPEVETEMRTYDPTDSSSPSPNRIDALTLGVNYLAKNVRFDPNATVTRGGRFVNSPA